MRTTRIILAALAVATIAMTAPAQAGQPGSKTAQRLDVAAIPAYPLDVGSRGHRASRQDHGQRVAASRSRHHGRDLAQGTAWPSYGLVTVPTAAGIDIKVALDFAPKAQAVIAAAEAEGIHFTRIRCYSASGHARHSNHHMGRACDTRPYIPAAIVRANGLRSGRDFHDPEHFDDATNVGGMAYWNSVRHPGTTLSAERRHRRVRFARR